MNSPFRPKTINVPGVLSDDAFQQQLKQYTDQQNAIQDSAPAPDSAVDFASKIQDEYLKAPTPSIARSAIPAALPGPLGLLASGIGKAANAGSPQETEQDRLVRLRSDLLSQAIGSIPDALKDSTALSSTPFGAALGLPGAISQAGTLTDPNDRKAAAEQQLADAKMQQEADANNRAATAQSYNDLSDEELMASVPGASSPEQARAALALSEQTGAETQKMFAGKTAEKQANVDNPARQPTQTWWLNAIQNGIKGVASIPIGASRGFAEAAEMARDASGVDLLTGGGRSNMRAWIDTVDQTMNKLLPGDKARAKDFVTQLSQGTGSMLGFLMGGYAAAAAGVPSTAATTILGAATGGDQSFQDAENFNATTLQKYMAFIIGAGIGTTEAIPIDRMFMRADQATGGLVRRMLNHTLAGSLEEFIQETGQQMGQDVLAKFLYDPNRKMDVGSWLTAGAIGALSGGLAGAATTGLHEAGVTHNIAPPEITDLKQREQLVNQAITTVQGAIDKIIAPQPQAEALPNIAPSVTTVQGEGGTIPVNRNGKFEATHHAAQPLAVIDPAMRGTGPLRGQERERLFGPDAVDRSYFGVGDPNFGQNFKPSKEAPYKTNTDPYHGEGLGAFQHTIETDPNKVYNWFEDPLNLKSQLDRTSPASEQVTRYEKLIKDAGFEGIYFSESPLGQTALMFNKTTPTRVVDQRYNLAPEEIATLKDFANPTEETFAKKGGWAVVTATQEALGDANAPANVEANAKLRKELTRRGIPFQEIGGTYQGVDQGKSFLVMMPERQAVALGKKYKQESVLTRNGLEYSDGRLVPAVPRQTVVGDKARAQDFFSTLPSGQAFSVGLDFGHAATGDLLAQRQSELDKLSAADRQFLDEEMLANRAPVRTGPLPMFPERTDQSFDRWFGDSVVVNPDGTPKVVFHGTPTKDGFRIFDPNKTGKTSVLFSVIDTHRNGFFFAENEEFAKTFADQGRAPGKIMPVFLSIQHPLDVTESTNVTVNALKEIGRRAQEIDPSITDPGFFADRAGRDDFWEVLDTPEGGDAFVQAAKDMGYDGIRMYEPNHDTRDSELVWVAFDNTQIKSAEENTGAYSPTNPDIHAQRMGTSNSRQPVKGEPTRPAQGVASQQGAPTSDVSLAQLSKNLIGLMDLTARQGRITIKGPGVLGQYSRKQDVIRVKTWNDFSTLAHEAGHALYFDASDPLKMFIAGHDTELMDVATKTYGGDVNKLPKAEHIAEGFAELFRLYATNKAYAQREFPAVTSAFESVLEQNAPELKQGLDLIGQQFAAWLQLPSVQLVRNMIVPGAKEVGINAAIKELRDIGFGTWMQEYTRKTVDGLVNKYTSVNAIVRDLLNLGQENKGKAIDLKRSEDPRILIRLAQNAGARAMVQASDGIMGYHGLTPESRSLRDALLLSQGLKVDDNLSKIDPVKKQDFAAYLVALRGIDEYRRFAEGKIERPPLAATLGDLQQTVQELNAAYPKFAEAAQVVNEYGMALWKKSYDAGLMDKETYTDGLDRQFYAPLQRDMSDRKASLGASALTNGASIVKRFRGSDRNIVDPMDVLLHKTFATEQIIAKNDVAKALGLLADRAGRAGALVERIPSSQLIGKQYSVKEIARQLTKDDTISASDAQDLMEILQASIEDDNMLSLFRAEQASTKGENVLFYWEDGRLSALQVQDGDVGADLVNVMNGLGRENMPMFVNLIAQTSAVFRSSIVSWPDFLITNFIRDQMSAFILTDVGYKPFVTGIKGVFDELRQRQWAQQYNASMGIMGGMNVAALHEARVNRDLNSLRKKGYIARAFTSESGSYIGAAANGMAHVVELTETGTRLGIYKAAFQRAKKDGLGDWDAAIEAGYTATDYIDFGLNGSRMLLFRKTIPFLNAQLQGLNKMLRTLGGDEVRQRLGLRYAVGSYFKSINNLDLSRTEKMALQTGRKAWIKMASLGLISAALHFLFEDDPDYQEAGEYLRTTGWVIPLGNGRIFYIPKPFELAMVANFTERGIEAASGDPQAKFRFMRGLAMTLSPPTSPPAIQTAIELAANKDFFTGREIVPGYMQALQPQLQYDNYTTQLAKQIGQATGLSPMVVDHIMSSLGASAYRDLTTMYNSTDPNRPALDATDVPILRRFVRDVRRGSVSAQDFWKIASTVDGSLRTAEVTYKNYLEGGNTRAADEFLLTLSPDERAYAILATNFKADAKRLNPFYRARQVTTIISAMRREMVSELGLEDTTTKIGDTIKLSATEKQQLDDALSEYARREMRNTLIAEAAPGWAGKRELGLEPTHDLISAIDPRVSEELDRRLNKAKVYSFDIVNEYWPEVRDRLNRDRENTFLKDILTIAKVAR